MKNLIRLDKLLSETGYCSKKKALMFLKTNEIFMNGIQIFEPGLKVNLSEDDIRVNGKLIEGLEEKVYYLLNKPKGVISTVSDEHKRTTVVSLIPENKRIFPVGRLDENTTGLIILTNDGELSNKLTHPAFHLPKTYQLTVKGFVPKPVLEKFKNGVLLKDGKTLPAEAKIIRKEKGNTILEMTITEGKNRQIRRMCGKLKVELLDLKRIAIGSLKDETLRTGEHRKLNPTELDSLTFG